MKAIKRLVAANGKYMKDGQEKTRWQTIGKMLKRDDGTVTLKLDSLPIGDWDGWISVFDLEEQQQRQPEPQPEVKSYEEFENDIPF